LAKSALDFLFRGVGMISPQVLTHQPKPRLEQIERRAKRVADGWSGLGHTWIVASKQGYAARRSASTCLSHEGLLDGLVHDVASLTFGSWNRTAGATRATNVPPAGTAVQPNTRVRSTTIATAAVATSAPMARPEGFGDLKRAHTLSPNELDVILTWATGGNPRGALDQKLREARSRTSGRWACPMSRCECPSNSPSRRTGWRTRKK
jgi:hypothetical protein